MEDKNKEYVDSYKNMFISFSGGRTSAYMTKYLLDRYKDTHNMKVVFANTGQEHEETLKFIDACDRELGFNTIWVEAVVYHGQRKSNGWKVVNFETACRDGSIFMESFKKYGLPNMAAPHCTRDLKLAPLNNYIKDNGWKHGDYLQVVGIRSDEIDRINPNYKSRHYWYPLADAGIKKPEVLDFFKGKSWDLNIPEYLGNCVWCWKKTIRKHMTIIDEHPEYYDVPAQLEKEIGTEFYRGDRKFTDVVLFRKNRSTKDLFELHKKGGFNKWVDEHFNDCAESCEAMGTEASESIEDQILLGTTEDLGVVTCSTCLAPTPTGECIKC